MSGIKRKRDEDHNQNTKEENKEIEVEDEEVKEKATKKPAVDTGHNNNADTKNIPKTPKIVTHLVSPDARAHIAWLEKALDAKPISLIEYTEDPTKLMHASVAINDSIIFLCDDCLALKKLENKEQKIEKKSEEKGKEEHGEGPSKYFTINLNVDDTDAVWNKAIKEGAKEKLALADQFWGDRYGMFHDPYGFSWSVACPVKKTEK